MAQSKILVDTNCYLRLAQSIHPLLFSPFGQNEYCLYVIPELNVELQGHRLRSKFPWIDQSEFVEGRNHSRVDARFVAYALELQIPLVTDDEDMIKLAKVFGATVMRSLDLLKLMLDEGHVDKKKIEAIVAYWRHVGDTPGQLTQRYRQLFGEKPP